MTPGELLAHWATRPATPFIADALLEPIDGAQGYAALRPHRRRSNSKPSGFSGRSAQVTKTHVPESDRSEGLLLQRLKKVCPSS
jgi:hypothetical protein